LVVDEVHERHLDADFLLALLRAILPRRPSLKLVMMSATVDEAKFAAYFADVCAVAVVAGAGDRGGRSQGSGAGQKPPQQPGQAPFAPCPVLSIPGFAHPVEDLFLDDVASLTGVVPRNLASERARAANARTAAAASGGSGSGSGSSGGGQVAAGPASPGGDHD
jgi:HrpA-like RNA helicase